MKKLFLLFGRKKQLSKYIFNNKKFAELFKKKNRLKKTS